MFLMKSVLPYLVYLTCPLDLLSFFCALPFLTLAQFAFSPYFLKGLSWYFYLLKADTLFKWGGSYLVWIELALLEVDCCALGAVVFFFLEWCGCKKGWSAVGEVNCWKLPFWQRISSCFPSIFAISTVLSAKIISSFPSQLFNAPVYYFIDCVLCEF